MGLNNKKYLDYAGLEKLVNIHAVVPHPQVEITEEGAYKLAFDEHGHITSKSPLTARDLGLDNALHFVGVSTTDPTASTGATVTGHTGGFVAGDVCIYKRSGETGYEEYIYTGTAWELLGDADSYALKSVNISGDNTYITGGGTLAANRTLTHKTYTAANAAIKSIGRDSGGHVVIGKDILVQSSGGHSHDHTTSTPIAKDTYVTSVTDNHTQLSISPTTAKVLNGLEEKLANLNTTSIIGVSSGNVTASKATAGTAISVAKAGTEVVYGEANVGTEVTGLAKRAASTTKVGNANIATSATIIGNADVGDAVVYGTADVGSQVTVQDGKADVGAATRYGTANVGTAVAVATQDTAQTKVGNADVGAAVVYGTANVGDQITVDAGKADVGTAVTVATRASSQTTVGNANVGTGTTVASGSVTSVTAPTISVTKTAYNAEYEADNECLVLSPITITASAPTVTLGTKTIKEAVSSETKIYAVGGTTNITPAVASNRTVSFTPATAAPSTQTLTPAKAVSDASTKIYGVAGSIDITPATEAPASQTLTPAVASNRTKSFTPAKAADTTRKLTPAKAATATIYGAVESTTEIYGVTADQVSIKPAVQSTKKIVPAVANGTITPYTFSNVNVPIANPAATTVATGSVSVGGAGAAIMTGVGVTDLDVMTAATIVKVTAGDVEVVDEVTATKNAAVTFTGTTDTHTEGTHTHTLYTE